jgi:glutaminyl-peptide cyclotransferase
MRTLVTVLTLVACTDEAVPAESHVITFEVAATYPHDRRAFTQGLVFEGETFLEGTGLYGESTLRRVNIDTGEVTRSVPLASSHFGEGVALLNGRVYQITWRSGVCFLWQASDFAAQGQLTYTGEGWGLTHDGRELVMSDGTDTLRWRDPTSFAVTKSLAVRDAGKPVRLLNELEWVQGEVWANVWHDTRIARIDPASGEVRGWLDLAPLVPSEVAGDSEAVLNGIAYDATRDRIYVTGKNWPVLYELKLTRR